MSFDWSFFIERLFFPNEFYLWGLFRTITIAVLAQLMGIVIGLVVGYGRLSKLAAIRVLSGFYVWFMRGIPVLVLLVLLFSGLAAAGLGSFQDIYIGTLAIPSNYQAAVVGLGIHSGAYMAEVIRNGIQSVLPGQIEAAKALGFTRGQIARRVVIPQAIRVIIPPTGNEFNGLIKTTSLVSVIGVQEIFLVSQSVASTTFKVFEMMLVVSITYIILTGIWTVIQGVLEIRIRAFESLTPAFTWREAIRQYLQLTTSDRILVQESRQAAGVGRR
jgi:polar amino acid transport system permease protein